MGVDIGNHHLSTFIQMKVITDHVLKDEWQSAKEMYPVFEREMLTRTKVKPVLSHNFLVHLRKLCEEGRAESKDTEFDSPRLNGLRPIKLFRRKIMGECSRCGECCKFLPIAPWLEMTPAQRHYLDCRATLRGKVYVVYFPCKFMIEEPDGKTRCGVEDNKPEMCRIYKGNEKQGKYTFWVPDCCTMAKK